MANSATIECVALYYLALKKATIMFAKIIFAW